MTAEEKASFGETMLAVSQRLITVVVADIRDSTGLSRRIGEARTTSLKGYEHPMPAYGGRADSIVELRRILA